MNNLSIFSIAIITLFSSLRLPAMEPTQLPSKKTLFCLPCVGVKDDTLGPQCIAARYSHRQTKSRTWEERFCFVVPLKSERLRTLGTYTANHAPIPTQVNNNGDMFDLNDNFIKLCLKPVIVKSLGNQERDRMNLSSKYKMLIFIISS